MSNQVYRNNQNSKYSPSKLVNKLTLDATTQSIAASYNPNSVYWNNINGVTRNPSSGIIDYLDLILPGSEDIIPEYNVAKKPYTYFKVMNTGTYTINFVLAMQGATTVNEMRGVGIAIINKGDITTATIQPDLRGLQCQWGPSSGVVNPGPWCIACAYTGHLEAGQYFFPAMISSNGINPISNLSTHGQTTSLEYFKN